MLKSAVYPKCETGDYNDHGLDLQEDFSQVFNTLFVSFCYLSLDLCVQPSILSLFISVLGGSKKACKTRKSPGPITTWR